MGNYQETFKRYELKYLLSDNQYQLLRQRLSDKLKIDHYGVTTICNIYFDTPEKRLIKTSLEKPIYKEKLRLRSYGTPGLEDTVFVELKKKYKGIVYKRRERMELLKAQNYLYDGQPLMKETQITKEINWFIKNYLNLKPSMYISYDRIAMYGMEDSNLRVTFDSNILWREEDLWLGSGPYGNAILQPGQQLMEIKIPGTMPIWLAHILDELNIYPSSFSKYGKAFLKSIEQPRGEKKLRQFKGEKKYA